MVYNKDKDELRTGSSENVYVFNDDQQRIKDQMNQNSIAWWSADDAGKKTLEEANRQLAANLGGSVGFDSQTGKWSGVASQPTSMKTGVDMAMPTWDYNSYLSSNPKPTYQSQYSDLINAKLDEILNREAFSYDLDSDPLYQQYKKQYIREGNRSMNDTLASMATDAGGMNSWAVTAAQQAGDYHMSQLNDRIPELYQLAYGMYLDDLNIDQENLGILQQMDNTDYGRYRDSVSDWYTDYNNAYTDYRDSMGDYKWGTEFNYNAEQNQLDRDWEQMKWDYNVAQDEYEKGLRQQEIDTESQRYGNETAYDRAMEMLLMGVMPNSTLLKQAGISDAEAKAMLDKVNVADLGNAVVGSTGGGDTGSDTPKKTGGSYDNGSLTREQVIELQNKLGVTADGLYGAKSKEKAKGLSADEAYDKYVLQVQDRVENDEYDPTDEEGRKFWNSMTNLGIGPAPATLVEEIANYGGVVENPDGTVQWANGWNKDNYKEKLEQMRKILPGWGVQH